MGSVRRVRRRRGHEFAKAANAIAGTEWFEVILRSLDDGRQPKQARLIRPGISHV